MLNIKKIVVLYLAGILLLTSVSIISLADPDPIPNTITISYSFSEPEVSDVVINGKQFTRATIDGLENSGLAGEPALPKKTARVLLPPKSSITSIEVIKEGMGVINNIDSIELGPISYHPISNPEVEYFVSDKGDSVVKYYEGYTGDSDNYRNEPRYDTTITYPKDACINLGVQYKRGFPILQVDLYPAQYDASSKTLTYYSELELTVKTKEDGTPVNPFYRRRIHDFSVVGDIIDNPDMLDVYEYLGRNDRLRPFNDAEGGNMLIITTSELEQVEDQYNLSYLAEMHEKNKINKVFIRTVESIYDMYEFSGSEYISGGKNPWERDECYEIRECIKDYYSQKGVDYVLLVGDDDYQWQSNWVYPYLNAPLIRGYNIEDEQEVPTFQTYLYTIEAWAKRGGDDGCPDDDNGGGDDDDDDEDTPDDDNPDDDIPDDGTPDDGDIDPSPPDPDEGDPDSIIDGTSDDSGTDGNSDGPDSDDIDGEVPPESPDDPDTPGDDEGNDNDNNNNPPGKWECVYRKQITTASDLPYACLDNAGALDDILNYPDNYKGPKFFPDFLAEVYVGRAPVSNPDELKNFVKKTVSYMKSDKKDYHKVLMVGEYLGFGGPAQYAADALNELLNECDAHGYNTTGIPLAGSGQDASFKYSVEKLYEKYGSWTGSDLINTINGGNINIVNHLGHANVNFNMKLGTPGYNYYGACSVGRFDNEQYPIFYSQGCFAGAYDAGAPFYDDCIAEYMTVKNEHGGVAGIWNSHFGWGRFKSTDGPSQRYHREFIDAIYGEEISTLGMANQDSKEDNIDNVNCWPMLWLYYCINLIGDPALNVQGAPGYSPSGDLDDDDDDTDGDDDDEESSPIKDFIKKLLNGWPGKLLEFILFLLSKV